jgi:light-regulated signal transduction histidine kinase (bacteriophytochrome)
MPTERVSQVLVVEDELAELQTVCELLQSEGFQVIGCQSAQAALEHVRQRDFGVAVVDVRLPDLSGAQLLQRIHSVDDQVRVIIYTDAASYNSIKEALELGAFAYLEKQPDRSELLKHVRRACFERVGRYASDLERAVDERTAELERSCQELETFASIVAHDLRSPLLTISGYCQLLREDFGGQWPETAEEYVQQIANGVARMDRLIADILEYSRAARSAQAFQPVNMGSVVTLAMANLEAVIREVRPEIEVGLMPTVFGDQTQLIQLLQNLIGNAIKFHRDSPRVRITASRVANGWEFAVEDNGIGIEKDQFDRVFQAFQRLHGREYDGTGIGLTICKKIVERHGGRLYLDSELGKGTTFRFTIPDSKDWPSTSAMLV